MADATTSSITIGADPEHVMAVIADFAAYPEWADQVKSVEILDTGTAARFVQLARAVELLGAKCVLTGIRPAVAQALVHLDVGFGALLTMHNLKHGLHYCLSRLRDPR